MMLSDENDSRSNSDSGGKAQHGGAFVPQYSPHNRMLMRSPLPSPTAVRKKKVVHVARNNNDSDSEDGGFKKREEAHISRLVHMAKAQQNLMTAWFAASAGEEDMMLPLPPRRKPSRRKSSGSSSSRSIKSGSSSRSIGDSSARSSSSGPIDLDSGAEWDEENSTFTKESGRSNDDTMSLSSQSSSTSSKMKAFLTGIIGGGMSNCASSVLSDKSDRSPPSLIVAEGTNPTTSYDTEEILTHKASISCCGREWSRNRIILGFLILIFGAALITILASSLEKKNGVSKQQQSSVPNEKVEGGGAFGIDSPPLQLKFPTTFPTIATSTAPSTIPSKSFFPSTMVPSSLPSKSPSMTPSRHPSYSPSGLPTTMPSISPTTVPSLEPSITPSQIPTAIPSVAPTSMPSSRPSQSQLPSWFPSSSPSTLFSTTVFEQTLSLSGDTSREEFGYGVAMNEAATVLAVGARYHGLEKEGRVQVYQLASGGGGWIPKGPPIHGRHAQDQCGWSVALNGDGNILAVSEPGFDTDAGFRAGNVRAFVWNDNEDDWMLLGSEIPGEGVAGLLGVSLSLSSDGTRLAVGSPLESTSEQQRQGGRVRIYELQIEQSFEDEDDHGIDWSNWSADFQLQINNATWQRLGQPLEGDNSVDWFGWSIDMQGDDIAIGAPRNREYGGYVRIFRWNNRDDEWAQVGSDINNDLPGSNGQDRFGMSISLHHNRVAIGAPWKDVAGAPNVGLVAVYTYDEDAGWSLAGTPIVGNEPLLQLGLSVCLRKEGYLTVGAPGGPTGKVGFYRWDGESWDPASVSLYGEYPKEDFGHWVVANDDFTKILVGSPATTAQSYPGSIRVFERGQD